jgi:SAM-dependent methyltransferase
MTRGGNRCPACGGALARWREVPAGEPADPRRFTLLRCEDCGSAVTVGEPPGRAVYETGVYTAERPRAPRLIRALQRATVGQPVRLLRRAGLERGARVLDAGAGTGRLVAALRDAGYDARGIDPSRRSVELAAAEERPIVADAIQDHDDAGLDAVVLWHVIEHLPDPTAALARVRAWLRPGGLLVVGAPNVASLQARIAGPGWLHWDAPRHRLHPTAEGLSSLLTRSGFVTVRTRHLVWEQNPHAMWMGLLSRLGMTPGYPFHLLKRTAPPRPKDLALVVAGLPLAPVAALLEAGAAAARRGGTVAVVARAR